MQARLAPSLIVACLLLVSSNASALLVETPLLLAADRENPSVGDLVTFTVEPRNESVAREHSARSYVVEYRYDPVDEEGPSHVGIIGNVTLDAAARGSFSWTIPADVKDKNVFVAIVDGGADVGLMHVAIENAPAVMFAQNGAPEGGGPEPDAADGAPEGTGESGESRVPFAGAALIAVAVLAAALLARRRR